jgi:iron(III) transport system ATP-binding protein
VDFKFKYGEIMVELLIENIHIMYDDFHAVKGVDLKIKDSDITTLLGPSGCGKTSVLRVIAGFINPSQGKVFVDNVDITQDPPQKRDMGMIFQNYALWPHMTVEANIGYGLKIRKIPREERKKRISEMVDQVQRALVIKPKVLLCDEPLSNLDFKLRVELRTEIRDVAKEVGVTVVYVTHDQTEALAISDTIAIIDEGYIVQVGSPINIFTDPDSLFVANFVGENNLLKGTISNIDAGRIEINLQSNNTLSTNIAYSDLKSGTPVDIITRYDNLVFQPEIKSNLIRGKLKHLAYMGTFLQVEIRLEDGSLFTMNVEENIVEIAKLPIGSDVTIHVPESAIFLFEDNKRIR